MHTKQLRDHTAEGGHKWYNDGSENQHDILEKKTDERTYFLNFLSMGKHISAVASEIDFYSILYPLQNVMPWLCLHMWCPD